MTGASAGETVLRTLSRASERALLLGSLVLLVGCGSRSRLLEPAQGGGGTGASSQGGAGGATGGFGGVPTGGGGAGAYGGGGYGGTGGAVVCGSLFSAWPTIEVQHPSGVLDGAPQLAESSDDGARLTVALVRQKTPGFKELKHASFLPWQDWPSVVVEPTFDSFASSELSESFVLGASFGNRVALLTSHVTPAGSGITSFSPEVEPAASSAGPSITLSSTGQPLFVSRGPAGRHLVATSDGKMLMGHVVTYSGASSSVQDVLLACGNGVTADAVPYEDGWLVALANEPTAPPTGCSAAANGASRLDVVRVGPDGSVSYVLGIDGEMPITRIAAAPHPSGVWVVWRAASGGKVPPLRWARFDVPNVGLVGPGELTTLADFPLDDFDAAALGSQLLVAWGNDPAGNPPDLTLTLLDPNGGLIESVATEPPFAGPLSLATSSDGQHVVVGWREADYAGGTKAMLARYDCYGGL